LHSPQSPLLQPGHTPHRAERNRLLFGAPPPTIAPSNGAAPVVSNPIGDIVSGGSAGGSAGGGAAAGGGRQAF
jgi:hypothetical protein